jgi:hypothetical protein
LLAISSYAVRGQSDDVGGLALRRRRSALVAPLPSWTFFSICPFSQPDVAISGELVLGEESCSHDHDMRAQNHRGQLAVWRRHQAEPAAFKCRSQKVGDFRRGTRVFVERISKIEAWIFDGENPSGIHF